jgi:sugar phosphate isomerase/epimerase
MRLAISNIAWLDTDEADVIATCQNEGIDAIEVAPARLEPDPMDISRSQAQAFAERWQDIGLPVQSMQALLFGRPDLKLFGPDRGEALVGYLSEIFQLAGSLGVGPAVFGSPGNRTKGELTQGQAIDAAVPVFSALGDAASRHGVALCLEPNATGYGCDFMTNIDETATVVREIAHPSVGLIIDTGNMQMAGDSPEDAVRNADIVRHFHLSRPHLQPLDSDKGFVRQVLIALSGAGYAGQATIEMRRDEQDPVGAIGRACAAARNWLDGL